MSEPEQSVEAPVKTKKPMDETRLSQLAAARELAVKARKDKAILKQNICFVPTILHILYYSCIQNYIVYK